MEKKIVRFSVLVFLIIFYIFLITNISQSYNLETEESVNIEVKTEYSKEEIISLCQNRSLEGTVSCLVKKTSSFFIYNRTNDNVNLTFSELKTRGGDCRDWAFYYEDLAKSLGFQATTKRITISPGKVAHRFTIVSSDGKYHEGDFYYEDGSSGGVKRGWCVIDQTDYRCMELGEGIE